MLDVIDDQKLKGELHDEIKPVYPDNTAAAYAMRHNVQADPPLKPLPERDKVEDGKPFVKMPERSTLGKELEIGRAHV